LEAEAAWLDWALTAFEESSALLAWLVVPALASLLSSSLLAEAWTEVVEAFTEVALLLELAETELEALDPLDPLLLIILARTFFSLSMARTA